MSAFKYYISTVDIASLTYQSPFNPGCECLFTAKVLKFILVDLTKFVTVSVY